MRRALLRSTLSALISAAFALSSLTWGWMPGCVQQPGTSALHASHEHAAHGTHSHTSSGSPASNQCSVHLCCIQLTGVVGEVAAPAHLTPAHQDSGPAGTGFVALRPSHTHPFAQGPPRSPA